MFVCLFVCLFVCFEALGQPYIIEIGLSVSSNFVDNVPNYEVKVSEVLDKASTAYQSAGVDIEFCRIGDIEIIDVELSNGGSSNGIGNGPVQVLRRLSNAWNGICTYRDLVHHLEWGFIPGHAAGGSLCESYPGAFTGLGAPYVSLSGHNNSNSLDWVRFAHEIGHTLSLGHEDISLCQTNQEYFM